MTSPDRIGPRAVAGLAVIVLATFIAVTTEIVPVGLLPQLSRAFGRSEGVTGLLVTVYAALVVVLALPVTRLTGRLPRKPLLLGTIGVYALANLVVAVAPGFAVVCVGRALGGVAHAMFFSLSYAAAGALVPPRMQGRAFAVAIAGAPLGYVLGVPLATGIGAALGWRAPFALLAAATLVTAAAAAAVLPRTPLPAPPPAEERGPTSALVGAAAVNVLAFAAHYVLYTYVSAVLRSAGLPEPALAPVLLLLGVAGVAGLLAASALIDRCPRAALLGGLVVAAAATASITAFGGSATGAIVATALWVAAFGAIPVLFAAACIRTRARGEDLTAAVNNAASNAGIGLGAAVGGGVLALAGLPAVVVVAAAGFAVAAVLVLLLRTAFPAGSPHGAGR